MQDKVALVTGGSTGIGLATAQILSERGARVVLFARHAEDLVRAQQVVPHSMTVQGDVADQSDVERLFREVSQKYGGLDALFVNAGIAEFKSIEEADVEHYERLFSTNMKGAFLTMKFAAPLLHEGASVVFTSSVAADIGAPMCSIYGASKAAVTAFARNVSTELLERAIRVNIVAPGPTATPIQSKSKLSEAELTRMAPFVMSRMRQGRLGKAEEVAALVAFLLSSESTFIVGQNIAADGGMSGI
jgi:NAD(P)-dependent dehydrogenase (short-subunit alcohol dehydrogenase family)